ncbi:hypothetical protein CEXT_454341 [Caerostris extrusa]|uniref:Uncharacterized protein n=1 Tax=Caerostris extrusa TaxID=172846 RepID=A0AAV4MZ18_CAEEX|nr:hypothetical protein CEXT_454341 [Caerostris extrusa]
MPSSYIFLNNIKCPNCNTAQASKSHPDLFRATNNGISTAKRNPRLNPISSKALTLRGLSSSRDEYEENGVEWFFGTARAQPLGVSPGFTLGLTDAPVRPCN